MVDEVLKVQIDGFLHDIKIVEDPNFRCCSIGNSQSSSNSSLMVDLDIEAGFMLEEFDSDNGIVTLFEGPKVWNSNFENEDSIVQNLNSPITFWVIPLHHPQPKQNPFWALHLLSPFSLTNNNLSIR